MADSSAMTRPAPDGQRVVYRSDRRDSLREVWEFRALVFRLVERNLKVKYQRSVLGFVWSLFNPLLTVMVLIAVFSYVVRIQMPHYWAFLVSGYFVFNFILQMLSTASTVLREHAQLTKSAAFPGEVLILGATLARLFEFAIALGIVLLVLAVFHHGGVPSSFAVLPVLIAIQLLLVVGLVMPIAVASVFFRDIEHALPVVVMLLFYISPVFYPVSFVPEAFRAIYRLNPLAALLSLFHTVIYEGRFPSLATTATVAAVSVAICLIGYASFTRYKSLCAEIV